MKMSRAKFFSEQFFGKQRLRVIFILQIFLILITLFFGPRRIILDRDTLFISSVLLEDQGVYKCVASTALDTAEAEAQLIVLGKVDFSTVGRAPCSRNCPCSASASLLLFTEPQ